MRLTCFYFTCFYFTIEQRQTPNFTQYSAEKQG